MGEFLDLLERADENKDGRLSKDELRSALKASGLHFTRLKIWFAMRKCDLNRNGVIDGDKEIAKLLSYAENNWKIRVA
ncbi:Calcium-Binding Protein [Musa troglodytarum]|uniref:Calcium-Binding Protein n=1 Tax=Musa troglodytarum TaxID=320322 RepID=A0A9E7I809_9LILI|nr:Calcium-Binding Protein [Musa troglodytarum]